jgi:hypothetical protein
MLSSCLGNVFGLLLGTGDGDFGSNIGHCGVPGYRAGGGIPVRNGAEITVRVHKLATVQTMAATEEIL